MQKWQQIAPKLYKFSVSLSAHYATQMEEKQLSKWREVDGSNELFPFAPGAGRARRIGTVCLKEMGQWLALDLIKVL